MSARAKPWAAVFDYIVVGAGSAGCVLAHRLTSCGRYTVLVLEAGGSDARFWLRTPIGYGMSFYNPAVNWMYRTEGEAALAGRSGYWPRGKVLGGSSSINAMVFVRGQPQDFDDWAALGNPGWGWADVLPYFCKLEDSDHGLAEQRTMSGGSTHGVRGVRGVRGVGGPLHVSDVAADVHPVCEAYLQAGEQLGLPRNADINGERTEGVAINQITTRHGMRESASTAYLRPAMDRRNLTVRDNVRVTRVLFEGSRAVGVRFEPEGRHGVSQDVSAAREVILCAGAINTPQLLQLSGVGPAAELQALGIAVVADLPAVGRHLQDHLCIDFLYRSKVPTLNRDLGTWPGKLRAGMRYLTTRRGPLALSVNQGGGFVRSREQLSVPDLQLYFSPLSYLRAVPGKRELTAPDRFPGFATSAQPCRPTSRGHLALRNQDPFQAPLIVPNSLSTEHDRHAMLQASRFLRRLADAPALSSIIDHEISPGRQVQSDAQLMDDIAQRASTVFHPVSTCRMGPDALHAAVDASLRVHGLHGLRVVDASVFPTLTSGNTNAPVLMVAEKAADLILAAD